MNPYIKSVLNFLSDLIFVKRCPCCGEPIMLDADICRCCFNELVIPKNTCKVCGEPKDKCICSKRRFLYQGFTAPFYNTGAAKKGIYGFKFKNQRYAARFFGRQIAKRLQTVFPRTEFDLVVSVPPNRKSIKAGGFDHARLLAKSVAGCIGVPYKNRALKKRVDNLTQHTLNYEDRVKNVERAYKANVNLSGKRVLLVDDIKTTGATLNECAKQLCLAGAYYVYCVTAVSTPNKEISESIKTDLQR